MLVVSGWFEIAPNDREAAVRSALLMAAATREEPGCISYAFYADLENENRFRVFEEWQDGDALDRHFQTPHMAEFRKVLAGITITAREVKRYEVSGTSDL